MIRSLRRQFNANWSPEQYARVLARLEETCGEPPQFRISETPCFFPRELIDRMALCGREIVDELMSNPSYKKDSEAAIPEKYRAPNEDPVPLFVQADFGLDADLNPKLVEIQGFPSLYAYQPVLAECYREGYDIDPRLAAFPFGLHFDEYQSLLRRAIVGQHDPENVVLTEIDPHRQKTRHDFLITERLFCIRTVDITQVKKQGRRLFYERGGKLVPIHRIYNRAIVDEIERKHITLPFDFRDDLDVEWAGHPNWFFRLSKFSLPYLTHTAVPETQFLNHVESVGDPENYVLKPLFSFAGAGVVVGPSAGQIEAIPARDRGGYILQRRVDFRPVIETPYGPAKVEIRIMYLWLDELRPVNTIVRMGRGAQMGVDFNKGLDWVGAAAGFIAE